MIALGYLCRVILGRIYFKELFLVDLVLLLGIFANSNFDWLSVVWITFLFYCKYTHTHCLFYDSIYVIVFWVFIICCGQNCQIIPNMTRKSFT